MFGYVRPLLEQLEETEQQRFRALYCGLCHTLKLRYGLSGQWILNYDFVFLAALLGAAAETEEHRCIRHPIRRRSVLCDSEALALAADESVILTWWQLQDHIQDGRGLSVPMLRLAGAGLDAAYRKARALRPAFDRCVSVQLLHLHELERSGCTSMDRTADCFAVLLQAAAGEIQEERRRRVLEQLLYHLGRWIYLIDAVDDLKKDVSAGQYNPLYCHYGTDKLTEAQRQELMTSLTHSINLMASAYALEEFGVWSAILENIIYSSLVVVSRAVFDGKFHPDGLSLGILRKER